MKYRRQLKKKNLYKYKLVSGEVYMFFESPLGGIASWFICKEWRIKYNNPRLYFDELSIEDKVKYTKEVYELANTFPLDWRGHWISFLMLFDKFVLKDWED